MIRTVLTPDNVNLHIAIPKDYIGKQVEVLIYTTDEILISPPVTNAASLRGKLNLTSEQYTNFQQQIKTGREEWNKDI